MNISMREKEILNLIAYELTSNEIAERLFISPDTVKTHRKHLFIKLGARNIAGLVRRSIECGLLRIS